MSSVRWTIPPVLSATHSIRTSPPMPTNSPSPYSSRVPCSTWQTVQRVSSRNLRRYGSSSAHYPPYGMIPDSSAVILVSMSSWRVVMAAHGMWQASTARMSRKPSTSHLLPLRSTFGRSQGETSHHSPLQKLPFLPMVIPGQYHTPHNFPSRYAASLVAVL